MEEIKTIINNDWGQKIKEIVKKANKNKRWLESGFTIIPNRILINQELTSTNLRVYLIILMHSFRKGRSFPSHKTIAQEVGLKKRQSVMPHIKKLIELGCIEKEKRLGKSNVYKPVLYQRPLPVLPRGLS